MQITWTSPNYKPEDVTGRYARVVSRTFGQQFLVFETATCLRKGSPFYGRAGFGYTLREYLTDGAEIPEALRKELIESKTTCSYPL